MPSTLSFEPIAAAIGATVRGIDLNEATDADYQALYEALLKYSVLVFRDQAMTPKAHVALAESFGPLRPRHPFFPSVAGYDPIAIIADSEASPPENEIWHADMTADPEPPFGSVLHIQTVPPVGGDTLWCSMHAVHEALSPEMQRFLATLHATHDTEFAYATIQNNNKASDRTEALRQKGKEDGNRRSHPVCMKHPVTGRPVVYMNAAFTTHIEGLSKRESDSILDMVQRLVSTPRFQMRLKWEPDTVAIFDNFATQHHAIGDHYPNARVMHRVTIAGDRRLNASPFAARA
ncbi:MAG: TauD/TfdA family dioxygenase [Alphaproteobacteria bacterium]|nr:TauD/TfdA family dioxygenase [Alphaproteobacteria bacterium]